MIFCFSHHRTSICHLHLIFRIFRFLMWWNGKFFSLFLCFHKKKIVYLFCGWWKFSAAIRVCLFFLVLKYYSLDGLCSLFFHFVTINQNKIRPNVLVRVRLASLICSNTGFDDSFYKRLSRWFPLIIDIGWWQDQQKRRHNIM